ncbi:MAG: molybdopterin-dependent oxidoreductase, partial [bacterium]
TGVKLIVINEEETAIASVAAVSFVEDEAEALKSLAKGLLARGARADKKLEQAVSGASVSAAVEQAASLIMRAKHPVVLSSPALYAASANIGLLKGTVVSVPFESNAKGVVLMGLTSSGKTYREMTSGGVDLLYAVGEVPLTERPDGTFLIVQHSHLTDLAKEADLVLPSAAYLESEGTIVDYLGRLRKVAQAVGMPGEAKAHREIFAGIAKAMGSAMKEAKETDTRKRAKAKTRRSFSPFEKKGEFDAHPEALMESLNASVISGSRLFWLKEMEKVLA